MNPPRLLLSLCSLFYLLVATGCSSLLVNQRGPDSVVFPSVTWSDRGAVVPSARKSPPITAAQFAQAKAALGSKADWSTLALAQAAIEQGGRDVGRDKNKAVGWYLAGAELCARVMQSAPQKAAKPSLFDEATGLYNYALARIIDPIQQLGVPKDGDQLAVQGPTCTYRLLIVRSDRWIGDYRATVAVPTDEMTIPSLPRKIRAGVGAPLVLRAPPLPREQALAEFAPRKGLWYGRTLVADFRPGKGGGHEVDFRILDPARRDTTVVDGRTVPLAGDFTAAMAVAVDESKISSAALGGVFGAGKMLDRTGLFLFEPFDPNKIPVVLVHGLYSTPATWVPMLNELFGDPALRKRYQFWYFYYPTGLPIPYSAMLLRQELDRADRKFHLSTRFKGQVVFIGHSMGGLLVQQQLVNSGTKLEDAYLAKRGLKRSELPPNVLTFLDNLLIFRPRPFDGKAIFISTPHLGADMASTWFARLAARFITLPVQIVKVAADVVTIDTQEEKEQKEAKRKLRGNLPTGISNLAPNQPYFIELNKLPIVVPFYSIIGHNGEQTGPGTTDGIVPYWSSHLAGAQEEFEVRSGHDAQTNPQAIEDVKRILMLPPGRTR